MTQAAAAAGAARAARRALGGPRRLIRRLGHQVAVGREMWAPHGAPLGALVCRRPVAAGAPLWRITFVGRRRLHTDFDALAPGGSWRLVAEGGAKTFAALLAAGGREEAEGGLGLRIVERFWGLPGDAQIAASRLPAPARRALLGLGVAPTPPPLFAAYATHLDTTCPVAPSRAAQEARLAADDLRARWRRARGLTHEISFVPAEVEAFWRRMVAPHDRRRFGDTGALMPLSAFLGALAAGGVLVKVMTDAAPRAWVSGILLTRGAAGGLAVYRPGVADADALGAARLAELTCYHDIAVLDVARARGLKTLGLGLTRALAHNPIFRHKQALGATFRAARGGPRYAIWGCPESARLLARHAPLVVA